MTRYYINKETIICEIEKKIREYYNEYKTLTKYEVWISAKELAIKIKALKETISLINGLETKKEDEV